MFSWKTEQLNADYRRNKMEQADHARAVHNARNAHQADDERSVFKAMRYIFKQEQ